jgi:hypothetical protein
MMTFMRHRLSAVGMEADRAGAWAPFVVGLLLVGLVAWAVQAIPVKADLVEAQSSEAIPPFIEHFTDDEDAPVPTDDVIRIAWHPAGTDLGIPASTYRAEDFGIDGRGVVEHETVPAQAQMNLTLVWKDADTLDVTIDIHMEIDLEEKGILRMIIVEDGVEIPGRTPDQNAVVRLYEITIAFNQTAGGQSTVHKEFLRTDHGLSEAAQQEGRLTFIALVSDYDTEENLALLSAPMPLLDTGPANAGERVGAVIGLALLIFCLAGVVQAEWKREVLLPRLRGSRDEKGNPVAVLRAGRRELTLREVRVLPPWRLAKAIPSVDLAPGQEKSFAVQVKPERGQPEPQTSAIETEWSIKVDEMGGWVLDLSLRRGPAK